MSIYVLRSAELVKIGYSANLHKRVGSIVSGSPVAVEFVGHMPGERDVELPAPRRISRGSGMMDSAGTILRYDGNIRLTSCSKEGQPRTRWGAFALDSTSAESKGSLEGPAVCDRPFFRQDEHGVSNVFDLHRAGHARKQNGKSTVPSHRKHFVFPCLSGAMNADRARVVPCHSDEISPFSFSTSATHSRELA